MNMKRFFIAGISAFVFIFFYEFLVHGYLMMGLYEQTAEVWRPEEEANMFVMILSQFLLGMAIAFFYPIVGLDTDACKKGFPFAFGLGLVVAIPQIATFCYLPIPFTISLCWTLIEFVKSVISVLIVSRVYNRKS